MLSARTSILLCAFTLAMLAHAGSTRFGVALSAQQKRQFIDALVSTSLDDLEAKLPRKLRRLHVFSHISVCMSWLALRIHWSSSPLETPTAGGHSPNSIRTQTGVRVGLPERPPRGSVAE